MSNKLAAVFSYLGFIFWLIALLAGPDKKANSKNLTQGLIIAIVECIPIVSIVAVVFAIIAIVKILQGDENPELPLIGGLNWFDK